MQAEACMHKRACDAKCYNAALVYLVRNLPRMLVYVQLIVEAKTKKNMRSQLGYIECSRNFGSGQEL